MENKNKINDADSSVESSTIHCTSITTTSSVTGAVSTISIDRSHQTSMPLPANITATATPSIRNINATNYDGDESNCKSGNRHSSYQQPSSPQRRRRRGRPQKPPLSSGSGSGTSVDSGNRSIDNASSNSSISRGIGKRNKNRNSSYSGSNTMSFIALLVILMITI